MLSGLAMSVAGSSSPASGGEHLISHFIDMTAHAYDLPYDFHGCQVGVGTLTTAFIYEKLKALDPASKEGFMAQAEQAAQELGSLESQIDAKKSKTTQKARFCFATIPASGPLNLLFLASFIQI